MIPPGMRRAPPRRPGHKPTAPRSRHPRSAGPEHEAPRRLGVRPPAAPGTGQRDRYQPRERQCGTAEFRKRASARKLQVEHVDFDSRAAVPADRNGVAERWNDLASLQELADQNVPVATANLVIERDGKGHGRREFAGIACTGPVPPEFLGGEEKFNDPESVAEFGLDQVPDVWGLIGIGCGLKGRQESGSERGRYVSRRASAFSWGTGSRQIWPRNRMQVGAWLWAFPRSRSISGAMREEVEHPCKNVLD